MHLTNDGSQMTRTIGKAAILSTKALVVLCLCSVPAQAWWGNGHGILTEAAVLAQPPEVPEFFRAGAVQVAHMSFDPDIAKNRAASNLYDGEFPEHFFDVELLEGAQVPDKRHDFIALCNDLGVAPNKVGYAPFAITEYTQRLMIAFAEHRKWPENKTIQAKVFVYAGFLAHYAEDLAQPLHATIHYDGRENAAGEKTHEGIHETVDSVIERLQMKPEDLAQSVSVSPLEGDVFAAAMAQVHESNGKVDEVYALAEVLDPVLDKGKAFAEQRARRAVIFTASLYLTAWQMSVDVRLPGWLER